MKEIDMDKFLWLLATYTNEDKILIKMGIDKNMYHRLIKILNTKQFNKHYQKVYETKISSLKNKLDKDTLVKENLPEYFDTSYYCPERVCVYTKETLKEDINKWEKILRYVKRCGSYYYGNYNQVQETREERPNDIIHRVIR